MPQNRQKLSWNCPKTTYLIIRYQYCPKLAKNGRKLSAIEISLKTGKNRLETVLKFEKIYQYWPKHCQNCPKKNCPKSVTKCRLQKPPKKTPQNCFNLPKTSQKISVNIESILVSFAIFYLPKRLLFSRSRGGGMPIILWANSSAASIAADFFSRPIVQ